MLVAALCALLGLSGFAVPAPASATGSVQVSVDDIHYVQADDDAAPVQLRAIPGPQFRIRDLGPAVLLVAAALVLAGACRARPGPATVRSGRRRLAWLCVARC